MVDAIITYLPFYRVHELKDVFVDNWIQLGSKRAIAYVDNVYNDSQKALLTKILSPDLGDLEIRTGNWGDRNATFLTIIKDCISEGIESIVVDSDNNLSSSFGRIDAALCEAGFSFYTVMEEDNPDLTKYLARSKLLGQVSVNGQRSISVYGYRVKGTWNGIFYIGRKQAVKLDATLLKRLDRTVINDVEKSLLRIPAQLRNYMSDEITLGFIYYYSGISRVPWIISSHHRHHGSTPSIDKDFRRLLSSTAICGFARRLPKRKYPRATWLYLRYKVAQLYYATTWFIKN